jgi:hypothetical protein
LDRSVSAVAQEVVRNTSGTGYDALMAKQMYRRRSAGEGVNWLWELR